MPLRPAFSLQVSTNCFSTRPVLGCLQGMTGVPMAEEIVHGQPPQHISYLTPEVVQEVGARWGVCVCVCVRASVCARACRDMAGMVVVDAAWL